MLAPDDISLVLETFKKFYYEICLSDKTAYMSKSFRIYPTVKSDWFNDVKKNFNDFSVLSDDWYLSRIGIISDTVSGFIKYASTFSAIYPILSQAENKNEAIAYLKKLEKIAEVNIQNLKNVNETYQTFLKKYQIISERLDKSIEYGWKGISDSENKILYSAEQLFKLQSNLTELENAVSLDSLSSNTVENLANVYKTAATIAYSMVVNGLSVPYLSVGVLAYSFGKTIFDIVENAKKYEKNLTEFQNEAKKFNTEQKVLIETKVTLKYLYSYLQTADKQTNSIYEFISFWENEKRNLETVINSFIEKDVYKKTNSEILQLPIADSVWQSLKHTASKIPEYLNNEKPNSDNYIEIVL